MDCSFCNSENADSSLHACDIGGQHSQLPGRWHLKVDARRMIYARRQSPLNSVAATGCRDDAAYLRHTTACKASGMPVAADAAAAAAAAVAVAAAQFATALIKQLYSGGATFKASASHVFAMPTSVDQSPHPPPADDDDNSVLVGG